MYINLVLINFSFFGHLFFIEDYESNYLPQQYQTQGGKRIVETTFTNNSEPFLSLIYGKMVHFIDKGRVYV